MNLLLKKLLSPRDMEYLILSQEFKIVEHSCNAYRFAENPNEVSHGRDVRLAFPELVGLEGVLDELLRKQRGCFELKGICRTLVEGSLYVDLYIIEHPDEVTLETRLIMFLEDVTNVMLTEQALVQRTNESNLLLSALTASRNYIEKVMAGMADALLVTDALGLIKTVNQATQHLFGYSESELVNHPISMIFCDSEFLPRLDAQILPEGQLFRDVEIKCKTKTQHEIHVEFSCSAVQADRTDWQDFVYLGRDITQRKQAEFELHKALEKERELNDLKSRFIAMASHEFRTPLSAILLATRLLQHFSDRASDDKKREYLARIESSAKHMSHLLDDVLAIGQAESRGLGFHPKTFDLVHFCSELVAELQATTGTERIIQFQYGPSIPEVWMDEKLLRQILTNLLSNAIKYSPVESIIYLKLHCQDDQVIFEVQDYGIGIPLEDQRRVFEAFHRAPNVGNVTGTGLGLAIVRKCVEAHEGSIVFTSEVGVGTTFRVTLPLQVVPTTI